MSSTIVAADVSEPGQLELWQVCRAVTGLDGADLANMLSHFDTDDASMALALRGTLNAMEPESSAAVVRNFLRFLRDDVHMVPLDHVRWRTTCYLIRAAGFAHSRSLPNPCSTRVFFGLVWRRQCVNINVACDECEEAQPLRELLGEGRRVC